MIHIYKKYILSVMTKIQKNNESIRIYGTYESLNLLSSKKIYQFFIDETYRCLRLIKKIKCSHFTY